MEIVRILRSHATRKSVNRVGSVPHQLSKHLPLIQINDKKGG